MSRVPIVLFFGENDTDTRALAALLPALLPADAVVETKVLKRPPVLRRDAAPKKRASMSNAISAFARELGKGRPRTIVVTHRDCDAVEPAHEQSGEELERDLAAAGVEHPVAATPCWEIEAWWMLFPKAIASTRACWRPIDYGHRKVGLIEHAKEQLVRDLRPAESERRRKCRDYCESDGATIAQAVAALSLTFDPVKSDSLSRFKKRLLEELLND